MAIIEHTYDRPFIFLASPEEQEKRNRLNSEAVEAALNAGYPHTILTAIQRWDDRPNLHWADVRYYRFQNPDVDRLVVAVKNRDRSNSVALTYNRNKGEVIIGQGGIVARGFHASTGYITNVGVTELAVEDMPINDTGKVFGGYPVPSGYEEALVGKTDLGDRVYRTGITRSGVIVATLEPKL